MKNFFGIATIWAGVIMEATDSCTTSQELTNVDNNAVTNEMGILSIKIPPVIIIQKDYADFNAANGFQVC